MTICQHCGVEIHSEDEHEDEGLSAEDLQRAIEEAEAERDSDAAVDDDSMAYEDALHGDVASDLMPYQPGIETDPIVIAEAEALAVEIEAAFRIATIDQAPAWVEEQRRGFVNVNRYVTRQPGEHNFFRAFVDSDLPGEDIAVSVLLDYSGSMESHVKRLAQAGYACKRACDLLNIPCTVVLWDSDATVLWDATETAENVPTIEDAGSTDPTIALADLDNQRYEKSKHVVLIMTDGSWSQAWEGGYKRGQDVAAKRHLAAHKEEGRVIIGFGYGGESLARGLLKKGCDQAYAIRDLLDIPKQLEQTLIDLA